jgi:enoyl-CoA hydratase
MRSDDRGAAPARGGKTGGDLTVAAERAAGVVALSRPRAKNALSAAMRADIAAALGRWARDPDIYAVLLVSATEGTFCAGGDKRELSQWGPSGAGRARALLAEQYALLWRIECFTKPTISLIDGAVMGLGVGISLYGTHRVAGERYRLQFPETGIGLFPGNGVGCTLARMPGEIGMYLALTGRPIGRADAYWLGLITHSVPARRFGEIRRELAAAEPVDQLLDDRHEHPGAGELQDLAPAIARCFSAESPEAIIARLREEPAGWAEGVVRELTRRSPTSLKVTHRHLRQAREWDLRTGLIAGYRLACRCVVEADFYQGVGALLDDGQRPAKWQPERLEEVSGEKLEGYFASLGADELQLASRAEMQAFRR